MYNILAFIGGFEFMSHISFIKFKKYPIFKNTILYPIFSFIDPLIHIIYFYYCNDVLRYLFLFVGLWHFIKIFNAKFKNNKIINIIDAFLHLRIAFINIKYGLMGIIVYFPIKYFKLTW